MQCPEVDTYMSVAALPTFHVFHRGSKVRVRERAARERHSQREGELRERQCSHTRFAPPRLSLSHPIHLLTSSLPRIDPYNNNDNDQVEEARGADVGAFEAKLQKQLAALQGTGAANAPQQ